MERIKLILVVSLMILFTSSPLMAAGSLWQFYYEHGQSLPSLSERALVYNQIAEDEYSGTYSQNVKLLNYLENKVGFSPSTGYSARLSQSVSAVATTIYVTSSNDSDGYQIPCAAGNKCYFNIDPGTSKEERVLCAGVSSTAFTSCTRGLVATGNSETGSSTLAKTHNAGAKIIMTNVSQFYGNYVNLYDDQTIGGIKTFSSTTTFSKLPNTTDTYPPTADGDLATKKYADDLTNAGAADATESVKGIGEIATRAEAAAGTSAGATGARLFLPASMSTSSADIATTSIVVTDTDGKIKQNFLDLTENFTMSGTTTLATTTIASTTITNGNISSAIINSLTFSTLNSSTTDFGTFTSTSSSVTITSSVVTNIGWSPRFVELNYYLQGYDGAYAEYEHTRGNVVYRMSDLSIISANEFLCTSGGSDDANCSTPTVIYKPGTASLSSGAYTIGADAGKYGMVTSISISASSTTGFTFYESFARGSVSTSGAGRIYATWKAYR